VLKAGDGLSLSNSDPAHRAHPSVARPLRGHGLADCRRSDLWRRPRPGLARHLHLHARRIVVPQPGRLPPLDVTAPLPEHMQPLIRLIGFDPAAL
jgi:hypothetical protein